MLAGLGTAAPAQAQPSRRHAARHRRELSRRDLRIALESRRPQIFISSESLEGILGSRIDFVEDLGIEKTWFRQLKVVLRPATKHKFRFEYTPIKYEADGEC